MTTSPQMEWLPSLPAWRERMKALRVAGSASWAQLVALANARLDFAQTNALDALTRALLPDGPGEALQTKPVRLAILGTSTLAHLHAGVRIAGLRRGVWIQTYENDYGQYLQELLDPASALHAFQPNAILFALDAAHLTKGFHIGQGADEAAAQVDAVMSEIQMAWRAAQEHFNAPILHQTIINTAPAVLGQNEHRLPGSRRSAVVALNTRLREAAEAARVDLIALDAQTAQDGLAAWHDPALWHRSKQEVSPLAAPMYGELVGRVLAAQQGRSSKCLVLDLDNTLWGGVIGDDGLQGIVLGQGSPLGEGFLAVQAYAKQLAERGVILAVCSKNDEPNARQPFREHPEMVLREADIACFVANWSDKATNIRAIAQTLNIGLDSLVFLDDNPFERELVRQELPMVAVPEVSDDPARVPGQIAAAGYFEGLHVTQDDRGRAEQYQLNAARETLRSASTDMASYLAGLEMKLIASPFDAVGLQRIVQLINKTNQFNLTTIRYAEPDVVALMADPRAFGLQLRLTDRFGDNGVIGIVIGRMNGDDDLVLDTWLMSCRVLGRQVEDATLNVVVDQARALGAKGLIGRYVATAKNDMVKHHYPRLGFEPLGQDLDADLHRLEIAAFAPRETKIHIEKNPGS